MIQNFKIKKLKHSEFRINRFQGREREDPITMLFSQRSTAQGVGGLVTEFGHWLIVISFFDNCLFSLGHAYGPKARRINNNNFSIRIFVLHCFFPSRATSRGGQIFMICMWYQHWIDRITRRKSPILKIFVGGLCIPSIATSLVHLYFGPKSCVVGWLWWLVRVVDGVLGGVLLMVHLCQQIEWSHMWP